MAASTCFVYSENNPTNWTDLSDKAVFIPVLLAIWAVAEFALTVYNAYTTLQTVADLCVSPEEKGTAVGLFVLGVGPGADYGTIGKAGKRLLKHLDIPDKLNDTFRLLTSHASRPCHPSPFSEPLCVLSEPRTRRRTRS